MKRLVSSGVLGLALCGSATAATPVIDPGYVQLLQRIVEINTETRNVAGLAQARDVLVPAFEVLGLSATRQPLADTGREVLRFDTADGAPRVLLVGHLDTVFPKSGGFQHFVDDGERLAGPGVIDMKGGLVLMLNVLAQLKAAGRLQHVRVVINDDEEIGSPHSKKTLQALAKDIPYGLVFEPGLEDGAVVSSQSGVRWIKLTSTGKAAHAGLEPENGIDACLDLARKIARISALAQPAKGLTLNPGVIEGGTKPNVVCDKASVTFDVRFRSIADWDRTYAAVGAIAKQSDVYNDRLQLGTRTEIVQLAELPPLPVERTAALAALAEASARAVGQPFRAQAVGYGSDGNNLSETGIQLLVGVGPYGGGMHSDKEHMLKTAYRDRLALLTHLLQNLTHPEGEMP
ncbi:M20/M25/M40 family metallo-hydrolase [Jeongeupia naejangsanensis]|uniref:M20/M25/M40 family metallo-hydrolase n=1 Tax=Jeongeupia naejangsanensis TaxID=613195 RepID=A0ABS2BHL7_9NEIS|nr:M20/M25/M40 family metallo-hydrolase [Jeongeupia naejangsanensis]MBM3115110.1 M20/M25/M40 family metallo-hydrolase [Jeongeupia naejangsanensis]